jgi:hypothetical protein
VSALGAAARTAKLLLSHPSFAKKKKREIPKINRLPSSDSLSDFTGKSSIIHKTDFVFRGGWRNKKPTYMHPAVHDKSKRLAKN